MKQLLFLLFFPCLCVAQYTGNAGQKITLGEQTTADGLVYRGVANDTNVITPFSDTSAYIILDTANSKFYHYNRTTTYWSLAGGGGDSGGVTSFSAGTTGLTPSTATTGAVTLGGTLAVANGGTGSATQNFVDLTTTQSSIAGAKTFTSAVTATKFKPTGNDSTTIGLFAPTSTSLALSTNGRTRMTILANGSVGFGTNNPTQAFSISAPAALADFTSTTSTQFNGFEFKNGGGSFYIGQDNSTGSFYGGGVGYASSWYNSNNVPIIFYTNATQKMRVTENGEVWIGYTADQGAYALQVNGQIFATNATIATSDEKFKENITPLNKGLEIVNKLKPVTFNFISDTENNFSEYEEVGFIAQDVDRALSTETFSKSIVKAADDSEPTSTMGLATQNLIPILVKAIQEQQALIKALEQRILILENK